MTRNQLFTVGFIFDTTRTKVLLVHKQRPAWQKGKQNGVGGKYEPDESPEACIKRETEEETTLVIDESAWAYVGTIEQDEGDVGVLATVYGGALSDARASGYEDIEWFSVNALPQTVVRNLRWLIPLALEKLDTGLDRFSVRYVGEAAQRYVSDAQQ